MVFDDPGLVPSEVADRLDLWQINDEEYLAQVCLKIMDQEPASVSSLPCDFTILSLDK